MCVAMLYVHRCAVALTFASAALEASIGAASLSLAAMDLWTMQYLVVRAAMDLWAMQYLVVRAAMDL